MNDEQTDMSPPAKKFNLGTGIFKGWNDKHGIMLCGYEWGGADADEETAATDTAPAELAPAIFSNKVLRYPDAEKWTYDRRIRRWFTLWGHPLLRDGFGGDFEKCIVQTNWCDTQAPRIDGDVWKKLLAPEQVDNFIDHIREFQPRLLMLFGAQMIKILQTPTVLRRFVEFAGAPSQAPTVLQKPFKGRRFKIALQSFEYCEVVCLPHPSGSKGLSDAYIELFASELGGKLGAFKTLRRISQ